MSHHIHQVWPRKIGAFCCLLQTLQFGQMHATDQQWTGLCWLQISPAPPAMHGSAVLLWGDLHIRCGQGMKRVCIREYEYSRTYGIRYSHSHEYLLSEYSRISKYSYSQVFARKSSTNTREYSILASIGHVFVPLLTLIVPHTLELLLVWVIYIIGRPNIELYIAEILLEDEIFDVRSIYRVRRGYIASDEYSSRPEPIFALVQILPKWIFVSANIRFARIILASGEYIRYSFHTLDLVLPVR
jgi:hypothetical protein